MPSRQGVDVDTLLERAACRCRLRVHRCFRWRSARTDVSSPTGDHDGADALVAWLGGQPHVAAAVKRRAGIKGDLDHFLALGFLRGLLADPRRRRSPGPLLVLDEVETLQRVRCDVRDKALNALRQLIDEVDDGRFPGLYLLITGTPAFFDGPPRDSAACRRSPQRLAHRIRHGPTLRQSPGTADAPARLRPGPPGRTRARGSATSTSPACQTRTGFERSPTTRSSRQFATAVAGELGGRVGVAPRLFLRSSSATCSTGSTSSPTSTRTRTTKLTYRADRTVRRRACRA